MFSIEPLKEQDFVVINQLLVSANLPKVEITNPIGYYFKSVNSLNELVGTIGLEIYGNKGLLRSLVISPQYRKLGIAYLLVGRILTLAQSMHLDKVFLLTTTAEDYFEKIGFKIIVRENVPDEIKQSQEFSSLCPVSSIIMYKTI